LMEGGPAGWNIDGAANSGNARPFGEPGGILGLLTTS
jgi:hypothetical protein